MSIEILIPDFFGTRKFREKKLDSSVSFELFKDILEVRSDRSYSNVSFY
jgi:hypothetical protein